MSSNNYSRVQQAQLVGCDQSANQSPIVLLQHLNENLFIFLFILSLSIFILFRTQAIKMREKKSVFELQHIPCTSLLGKRLPDCVCVLSVVSLKQLVAFSPPESPLLQYDALKSHLHNCLASAGLLCVQSVIHTSNSHSLRVCLGF